MTIKVPLIMNWKTSSKNTVIQGIGSKGLPLYNISSKIAIAD